MKYSVRFYKPEDFEAVINLLTDTEMDNNYDPYSFGSKALVLEHKDIIIGFCWVIAGDSKVVYINDFTIAKKYRYRKNNAGLFLAKALLGLLYSQGYKNYLLNVQKNKIKMKKMLTQKLKGIICEEHHFIRGNIKELNESLLSF